MRIYWFEIEYLYYGRLDSDSQTQFPNSLISEERHRLGTTPVFVRNLIWKFLNRHEEGELQVN